MHDSRRLAALAAAAAGAASVGDLLLLWVAAGGDRAWLPAGRYLGVLCIPLYAVGYRAVARLLDVGAIFWIGLYASAVGAVIHGMTALAILTPPNASATDPFAALSSILPYLIPLWMLVGALTVLGSALQFRAVRADTRWPAWFAWTNPLCLILALAAVGALVPPLRSYVVPAAPNLAHIVYFAIVAGVSEK